MTLLSGWRIAPAADLLREPDVTLGSVAERVGYGSRFALSNAFKRVRGVSPRAYDAQTALAARAPAAISRRRRGRRVRRAGSSTARSR
jgi:AraC-like DNA-binding protein